MALVGWRGASIVFGVAAILIALGVLMFVREHGTDRAARAGGSSLDALRRVVADRDLRWLYLTSVLGGGGRGLGVVNLFALIYLTRVIGLDDATSGLMYGAPDRVQRADTAPGRLAVRPVRAQAADHRRLPRRRVGFGVFILAGSSLSAVGRDRPDGPVHVRRGPQLQALLADISPPDRPRRLVRAVLHDGVRVGACGRRSTA